MRRGTAAITAMVVVALVTRGCSPAEAAGWGECSWTDGVHEIDIDAYDQHRTFRVDVNDPDGPMVIALHGIGGTAERFEERTSLAAAGRGVVVTPDSRTPGGGWGRSPFGPDQPFLDELIACAPAGVDVHAVGFSSGGMMAARPACDGAVASAVVVAGTIQQPCPASPPMLIVHGTTDETVGWDGRMPPAVAELVGYDQGASVEQLAEWWDAELVVHDGGHTWPDDATGRAWEFIAARRG